MSPLNIAVVGSGISGLSCAWLLSKRHKVTVFERDTRLGGHSNTIETESADGPVAIDTGFIVYNEVTYPNLTALFEHLGVQSARSNMSFAVSLNAGSYEYSGSGISGLFGQPSNLLNPRHLKLVFEILSFFRKATELNTNTCTADLTLAEWLKQSGYSEDFAQRHILPMGAAIWSVPAAQMMDFPVAAFARFFQNHGLLKVRNRPKWRTVIGGSRNYVNKLAADFSGTLRVGLEVCKIRRVNAGVDIMTKDGAVESFDHCVLATHADQTLSILEDADALEQRHLSAFKYSQNEAVLHVDSCAMPKRSRLWSSWNYVSTKPEDSPTVTYWMNCLQPLATKQNYFVTLNPMTPIENTRTIGRYLYAHPVFNATALAQQQHLWALQGRRRTWFAGSYFGYGFHEDGLQAGLAVAETLGGVSRPWQVDGQSDRLQFTPGSAPNDLFLEAAQ